MAKEKKRQSRPEQVKEAEKIYEWLIFQRELAGDLIRNCTKRIVDGEEAGDTRLDLQMIAEELAAATEPGSRNAVWQNYKNHFIGDRNRKRFFAELRGLTRHIASGRLASIGESKSETEREHDEPFHWNASLLPRTIAQHVLRVAILHPGVLENFLPRFFAQV